ncbi:hypothetical protein HPB51_000932 [Rhipicephalus microplus]|uniref:glycerophosphocholine cholinephosphodiesterase n=1 Tax=Rhipicephalus microplus TaxID=6941 RepID=A0A9J6DLA6_RHIMP|nr:hypothetical protein HPB51_000932 [Rhipicephalus microplus]
MSPTLCCWWVLWCLATAGVVDAGSGRLNPRSPSSSSNQEQPRPKLLVILVQGVRADYIDHAVHQGFARLAQAGIRAEYVLPVFPSSPYPNAYSIATVVAVVHRTTAESALLCKIAYPNGVEQLAERQLPTSVERCRDEGVGHTAGQVRMSIGLARKFQLHQSPSHIPMVAEERKAPGSRMNRPRGGVSHAVAATAVAHFVVVNPPRPPPQWTLLCRKAQRDRKKERRQEEEKKKKLAFVSAFLTTHCHTRWRQSFRAKIDGDDRFGRRISIIFVDHHPQMALRGHASLIFRFPNSVVFASVVECTGDVPGLRRRPRMGSEASTPTRSGSR